MANDVSKSGFMANTKRPQSFDERPVTNERQKALNYISAQLKLALQHTTSDQRSDISELLEIQRLLQSKKYGLVWEKHREWVEAQMETEIPIFVEDPGKKIVDNQKSDQYNFILEGDNLHSLHLLEKTNSNDVDVIYIDPPYNTLNEGFTYNDKKVDSNDNFRHSKWISFMNSRLKAARNILTDRGLIFVSIDENEHANLRLLMDEIFGENNFVSEFSWRKKSGANDAKDIDLVTEPILLYSKNKEAALAQKVFGRDESARHSSRYNKKDKYYESRGSFYYDTLDRGGLSYSESLNYGIQAPDGTQLFPNDRTYFVDDGWNWKWGRKKVEWGIANGFIILQKSSKRKSKWAVKYKVYEKVDNSNNERVEKGKAYSSLITNSLNTNGSTELKDLFNNQVPFSNPKPVELIKYLINIFNRKDITILDFFAGSGTTGQAVMELNAEDGGTRRFILATNNENNIAEDVTYPRMKKVSEGANNILKERKFEVFKKRITLSQLKNPTLIQKQIVMATQAINEYSSKHANDIVVNKNGDVGSISFKDGFLTAHVKRLTRESYSPHPMNLKFFKTAFISKQQDFLEGALLKNVYTLIELQNGIDLSNKQFGVVITHDDAVNCNVSNLKVVYMRGRVHRMLSPKTKTRFQEASIKIIDIPEAFFREELSNFE